MNLSQSGIGTDKAPSFANSFGKVYWGEDFKTILTLVNTSTTHQLTNIKMKVIINRNK